MAPDPILTALIRRDLNSPAGLIRSTGRVLEALDVFDWLLWATPAQDRSDAETLVEYARECLRFDVFKRPEPVDRRRALVLDTDPRSTAYMVLRGVVDVLDQATLAGRRFGYPLAQSLVDSLDIVILYLCIPPEDVARVFADYYQSLA